MMGTMTRSEWSSWSSLSVDWLSWSTMTFRPWRSEILQTLVDTVYLSHSRQFDVSDAHYALHTSLYIFTSAKEGGFSLFSISWLLRLLAEEKEWPKEDPVQFWHMS